MSLLCPLLAGALLAAPGTPDALGADGDVVRGPRIEVSDDGRLVVEVAPQAEPAVFAGAGAPYGTDSDWENDIRRQVGGLQVADMNGDGWDDVVVGCYISSSFPPYDHWFNYIYYNTGGALEDDPSWISDDEVSTGDVQVADFNGDGFLDIFSANGGFPMDDSVIYYGSASGPDTTPDWSSNEPGNAWNNYALPFDVDGDGDLDVITANQGNSEFDPFRPMYLFENQDGALDTVPSWSSTEWSIQNFLAAGDVDGDGRDDIAVSKWVNWESGVYLNLGAALDVDPWWTTPDDGDDKGVALGDLDGDGDTDLVLGHDPTRRYDNDDEGNLALVWSATAPYFGHSDLRLADVDGDGDDDLAEIHFANGHVNIYRNEGGVLTTAPIWTYDSPSVGTAIAFGEINGDGALDLVVGNSGDISLRVFYGIAPPCPADLDGSGDVGFSDLLSVLAAWGPCGAPCPEDLDGSGDVGFDDLLTVLAAWGPC